MGKPQQSTEAPDRFDAGDETSVGERSTKAKTAERDRMAGLGDIMATKQGRNWMWWLLAQCGVFQTSFTGNSTTFFNEGKRQVGLVVMADIQRDYADQYLTMTKENAR